MPKGEGERGDYRMLRGEEERGRKINRKLFQIQKRHFKV
jgi:hypothetical protein